MGGVILRKLYNNNKLARAVLIMLMMISVVLSCFWSYEKTVYRAPLDVLHITLPMVLTYVYRFAIGFSISAIVIYIAKRYEDRFSFLSRYGQYSLVVYTASFVFLGAVARLLNAIDFHINTYLLIDVVSICLTFIIYYLTVLITDLFRRNRVLSFLFIGE